MLVVAGLLELLALQRAHLTQAIAAEVDEVVAGREVGDAVLELIGVEVVDVGEGGGGAVESKLRLLGDAAAKALAVPSLLPAPQQLAAGFAERVERADHGEVAHGAWTDGSAAEAVEEIVEGLIETGPVA